MVAEFGFVWADIYGTCSYALLYGCLDLTGVNSCCLGCLLKGERIINEEQAKSLRENLFSDYDKENKCLPSGICSACRNKLKRKCKNLKEPNYSSIFEKGGLIWTREREKNAESCSCLICQVGSSSGGAYKKLKIKISGATKKKENPPKRCEKCLSLLYQGCRHTCTRQERTDNLMTITTTLDKERITHSHLKEQMKQTEPDEDGFHEIRLRTRGRPAIMTVKTGRVKRRRKKLYQDSVKRAIANCGLSGKKALKFLRHMRHDLGRQFIVSGIRNSLVKANKMFDQEFTAECVKMEVSVQDTDDRNSHGRAKRNIVERDLPIVYCSATDSFLKKMKHERNILDLNDVYIKLSIDDGRGKLKISLSLIPKMSSVEDTPTKKFLEPFKATGVKRIMIIACSPVKETTHNLKVLTSKVGFNTWGFPFKIAADLSCINKLLGISNHKSCFCCYICHWNQYLENGITSGARKRTFASIYG